MPAGRGMGMMPPSKFDVMAIFFSDFDISFSGDAFLGSTSYALCAPWHVRSSAWIQASRVSSRYAIPPSTWICWTTPGVSH